MLESISWQEYISALTLAVITYYAITILLLYRNEIVSFFRNRKSPAPTESHDRSNILGSTRSVINSSSAEEHVNAEELAFAPAEPEEHDEQVVFTVTEDEDVLVKQVSELIEAISTITESISDEPRHEVTRQFHALLLRYPRLVHTKYKTAISQVIKNACAEKNLDFEIEEIITWWPV